MLKASLARLPALLLVCGMTTAASAQTLEALWRLETGSGPTAFDTSGNVGRDGALTGGATWTTTNVAPVPTGSTAAIDFDGNDGSIDTPYVGVSGSDNRTVSTWVNTGSTDGSGIVAWGDSNSDGQKWHIRINDQAPTPDPPGPLAPRVVGAIRTEAQGGNLIGARFIADNQWHHVVSVLNGTDNSDVDHYIDGRRDLISFITPVGINTDTTSGAAEPVTLGSRDQKGTQSFFTGTLDETSIYTGALSARDIRVLATGSNLPIATLNYNTEAAPGGAETQNVFDNDPNVGASDFDLQNPGTVMTQTPSGGELNVTSYWNYDGSQNSPLFDETVAPDGFESVPGDGTDESASFLATIRRNNQTDNQVIFETGGGGDGSSLTLSGDTLQFTAKNQGIDAIVTENLIDAGTADFIQILGVIDLEMQQIELFVDGASVGTDAFTGDDWAGSNDGGLAGIFGSQVGGDGGALDFTSYGFLEGDIAEFSYFTEALDATDAQNLFNASLVQVVPEPGSMAIWTLLGLIASGIGIYRVRHLRQC